MTGAPADGSRDIGDVDALVIDRYLESILAAHARGADMAPTLAAPAFARGHPGGHPDPVIRTAIERLARDLPRFHPSFRFEEALAGKLAEAAARMRPSLASGGEAVVVPVSGEGVVVPLAGRIPSRPIALAQATAGDDSDAIDDTDATHPGAALHPPVDPRPALGHPLLIGGALTSAAISVAGAAWFAWRIRHPQAGPMARAVRAIARARLA